MQRGCPESYSYCAQHWPRNHGAQQQAETLQAEMPTSAQLRATAANLVHVECTGLRAVSFKCNLRLFSIAPGFVFIILHAAVEGNLERRSAHVHRNPAMPVSG